MQRQNNGSRFGIIFVITFLALASATLVFAQTTETKTPDVASSVGPNPIGNEAIALTKAEILTDTMGANFGPYTTQVTKAVRQSWYSILPPSVYPPMRKQGKVSIEFVILKPQGSPKTGQ
jgi:hypothetical protein